MKRISYVALALMLAVSALSYGGPARAASTSDLLKFLPDGGAVVVMDVQRFLASPVWASISSQESVRKGIEKINGDVSELGLSFNDLQAAALVFPRAGLNNPVVAVSGSFDQSSLVGRVRANPNYKLSSERYKEFEVFAVHRIGTDGKASSQPVWFSFLDPRTAVVGSRDSVTGSIDVKVGSRPGVTQNAQLMEGLAQNAAAPIRFALTITPDMAAKLQSNDLPLPDFSSIKMIFGSVDLSSSIDLIATLRNDSAEHAKVIADRLTSLLMMVRGFLGAASDPKTAGIADVLKTVNISDSDIDVKITASIPAEMLKSILGVKDAAPAPKKP
jgi:hypothetical protein